MKKILIVTLSFVAFFAFGQDVKVLDDFESGNKGWAPVDQGWVDFQIVPNPAPDAVNSSANVLKITRHTGTQTYAGVILRNYMTLTFGIYKNQYRFGKVKFLKPAAGEVSFKLENGGNNGSSTASANYTTANVWQEVIFDLGAMAGGTAYHDFFIMPAKDATLTADVTVYIDDIKFETDPNATDPTDPNQEGTYQLVWSDEFNGNSLDETVWGYQMGRGENGNWAWGNNEQQFYTSQSTNSGKNIFVSDGMLTIRGIRESYSANNPNWNNTGGAVQSANYTSGRILTRNNFFTKYGRIEARISLPIEQGLWPAFWMMPQYSAYGGWPQSGEIDIMEAKGRLPKVYGGTIHFGNPYPNNQWLSTGNYTFPNNGTIGDFHVYAVEWEYGSFKWFCDDILIGSRTSGWFTPNGTFPAPFDKEFYIILNLAIGGNFDGNLEPTAAWQSGDMKIDYVRVYQKVPTATNNTKISDKFKINIDKNTVFVSSAGQLPFDIAIYSLTGQKLLEKNGNLNSAVINITSLGKSVYIMQVTDSLGSVSQKFVK